MRGGSLGLAGRVASTLTEHGVAFMLAGASALAARGFSRSTADVDFLTTDVAVLQGDLWREIGAHAAVEVRRGDSDDPLAGVVRLRGLDGETVDVVVVRWKWQRDAIERADIVSLDGVQVRLPRVSDLVLLKIDAGGAIDQADARALVELHGSSVIDEIDRRIESLPAALAASWSRFRGGF